MAKLGVMVCLSVSRRQSAVFIIIEYNDYDNYDGNDNYDYCSDNGTVCGRKGRKLIHIHTRDIST